MINYIFFFQMKADMTTDFSTLLNSDPIITVNKYHYLIIRQYFYVNNKKIISIGYLLFNQFCNSIYNSAHLIIQNQQINKRGDTVPSSLFLRCKDNKYLLL